jgi:hypothetical protein
MGTKLAFATLILVAASFYLLSTDFFASSAPAYATPQAIPSATVQQQLIVVSASYPGGPSESYPVSYGASWIYDNFTSSSLRPTFSIEVVPITQTVETGSSVIFLVKPTGTPLPASLNFAIFVMNPLGISTGISTPEQIVISNDRTGFLFQPGVSFSISAPSDNFKNGLLSFTYEIPADARSLGDWKIFVFGIGSLASISNTPQLLAAAVSGYTVVSPPTPSLYSKYITGPTSQGYKVITTWFTLYGVLEATSRYSRKMNVKTRTILKDNWVFIFGVGLIVLYIVLSTLAG